MTTITVSQLNRYVKAILGEDPKLNDIYIKAEISNYKNHYRSGHLYFNLKDEKSSVRGVMFAGYAKGLKFEPEEGMAVLVRASVGLYEVDGSYQVYVTDMQPHGVGAIEIAIRQLTEKLEKKGYFLPEYKKPLPAFPQSIGVITSKTGAAFGDIQKVLSLRYPLATIKFCPSLVQGQEAPRSLINALYTLDGVCDVIIIGRGGGSKEDLWAFNDEGLADAIFRTGTPVVSAVGHEIDISICDMVADHRAATPSAAAELVSPSMTEMKSRVNSIARQIQSHGTNSIDAIGAKLRYVEGSPALTNPKLLLEKKEKQLDFIAETVYTIQKLSFERYQTQMASKAAILEGLNPFAVLSRGYSAIFKEESPINSASKLLRGDMVTMQFQDGWATATVNDITLKGLIE